MNAGFFHVSAIHQTLTWTTGSFTCVCGHSYACVYTRGLRTPTVSQHNILLHIKHRSTHFLAPFVDAFVLLTTESRSRPLRISPSTCKEKGRFSPVIFFFFSLLKKKHFMCNGSLYQHSVTGQLQNSISKQLCVQDTRIKTP